MGAISRLRYVIAANVNALLEKAEDPEKLLRALIREMEDASEDARLACADLLAEQQHLERIERQLNAEVDEWQLRAERAVTEGRDDLARAALTARQDASGRLDMLKRDQAEVRDRVSQMEQDMVTLKGKLADAKVRLKTLQPGGKPAASAAPAHEKASPTEKKVRRAMARFDRLQAQVESLEARVRSYEVGGPSPPVWGTGPEPDPLVEEELAQLKSRLESKPVRTT
ncbi:MAG: PspA/IM30 family protein [Xanthomonadales bacterium]|nr:PspA/IM30 family protein [Xanthomonadales bacterium]